MFIKVTETYQGDLSNEIIINTNHIVSIEKAWNTTRDRKYQIYFIYLSKYDRKDAVSGRVSVALSKAQFQILEAGMTVIDLTYKND